MSAEAHGGGPSVVRTKGKSGGGIRLDFGPKQEHLEETSWDEVFAILDESELAFLHQDKTHNGKESRFSKFVHKHTGKEHG